MKYILLTLVVCCAAYGVAEPSCPPASDAETVVYYPHPSDCRKFLTCDWGNLVELSCPTGTFWNDDIKACDLQGNVDCSSQLETTTTEFLTTTSTTAAPTTSVTPTGKCPAQYDPDHQVYLPHEDCTKYYICTWGGAAIEQSCPPHLHWNQYLSYCDYPQQAGCTASSPPPSTSAPATTPNPPAPFPNDDCPEVYDHNHQVYFPHTDCTKYYICTYEGSKLEQNCPAGLHWSQQHSYCDRPEVAQCKSTKQADQCPDGYDPNHPSFYPHEQDCGRYYVCYDGQLIEHQCSDGLQWNQDAGKCDATGSDGCVVATVPQCPEVGAEEEQDQPVFFPHEDCPKYYVCSNGFPYEMNCPDGTFWNAQENVCDDPENSGCVPEGRRWTRV